MTDYKSLELKLRTLVEKRLEEGWNLRRGVLWVADGECCAVGSAMVEGVGLEVNGFIDHIDGAAKVLGIPRQSMLYRSCVLRSVSDGFEDCVPAVETDKEAYAIGARIRRDYCEWE